MANASQPLRILSLDGGGIRGLSSLLILEKIMDEICAAQNLDHVPRPCDYFDLIGGTSTGGIIAIMLGRLGMTVDDCIQAYRGLAKLAFTPKSGINVPGPPNGQFSAKALEAAIKRVIREYCVDVGCVTRRHEGHSTTDTCPHSDMPFRDHNCTKTVVLAITKDNIDAPPTLFKTYDVSAGFAKSTVWEVARATSAATTFFKSIKVGRDEIEFVDAGFGYNNPCEALVKEAERVFPGHTAVQILSLGTGLGDVVTIEDGQLHGRLSILEALKKMASSSKKVAASMDYRFADSGQYHRFNVEQGLQDITLSDWEKASRISAHTNNYLTENERAIKKFVCGFLSHFQESEDETMETGNRRKLLLPDKPSHWIRFSKNRHFVGREEKLKTVKEKLFNQEKSQRFAMFGLGGVGKTQVALELAHWAKDNMPRYSVLWTSALSNATFEHSCTQIATELGIQKISDESAVKSVQRHLSLNSTGPWLLIVDNADDMELLFPSSDLPGINEQLPESDKGIIFLTTRFRGVAVAFAGTEITELKEMNVQEATTLLAKCLIGESQTHDKQDITQLVEDLKFLPLAITQAAAYINMADIPISKYLALMRNTKKDAIGLITRNFPDNSRYKESHNAIASTWLISFRQIQAMDKDAAHLLSFISCIEPKAIPESLLPDLGSNERTVSAIGTLRGYGFLVRRDDTSYDMHGLVHLSTQIWVQREGFTEKTVTMALRHLRMVFSSADYTNRKVLQNFLPHSLYALWECDGQDDEKFDLYASVGQCLLEEGRAKEAVSCFERACLFARLHYPVDDFTRTKSVYELAVAYCASGQGSKAVDLLEPMVAGGSMSPPTEHLLASQLRLATAYCSAGQASKAVALAEQMVAAGSRYLPTAHPNLLACQRMLARAYSHTGQASKAVALLEHMVAAGSRSLPTEHPALLASQGQLATAYSHTGQDSKAVDLLEYVIAVRGKYLPTEHPALLASRDQLASAYFSIGETSKAVDLLEYVIAVRGKYLPQEHTHLLQSQHELAGIYYATGQTSEAIDLLEHVVAVRGRFLPKQHRHLLQSQHKLAVAYRAIGQASKANSLLKHVMAQVKDEPFATEHPPS